MKKIITILLLLCASAALAQSALYPLPASWSYRSVALYSQPRIIATSTYVAPATASAGDLLLFTNGSYSQLLRCNGSEWEHVATQIATFPKLTPSVASPTGTIGTGTIWMDATGTVRIFRNGTFEEW